MSRSGKKANRCSDRHREIVEKLDELVESWAPYRPLYSKELAEQIGVSTRTLQSAALEARDMTLHGYLRWKRLMAARQKLQHGTTGVKDVALESGFWHLSYFAGEYRKLFGELPSSTLRSARLRLEQRNSVTTQPFEQAPVSPHA
jgi:AraC family transcriptional regulator, ethanolamine operon transcriptional activator